MQNLQELKKDNPEVYESVKRQFDYFFNSLHQNKLEEGYELQDIESLDKSVKATYSNGEDESITFELKKGGCSSCSGCSGC